MFIQRPRSFKIQTWKPEIVVITGLYWGWTGLVFPLMLFPFFFTKWMVVPLALGWLVVLGYRFRLLITRQSIEARTTFMGVGLLREVHALDEAWVQYGFDMDRLLPPDVEIGSFSIGDETNAIPLFNTIKAAIAHVQGKTEVELAHCRLASPVCAAPTKVPVAAREAAEVIKRYRALGLEVLMVRGWKLEHAQRITLYVISETCIRVFDAYIPTLDIHELEALRPTLAHDDEMAFTMRRRYVWTEVPFRLWQRGTKVAQLYPDSIWTAKREVNRAEIVSVRGWLSESWAKLGVDLETMDGERVEVAVGHNPDSYLNPFYDGIDLMFDVEWVESISRILACELDVPLIDDNLT